jgi:hypothetical protein
MVALTLAAHPIAKSRSLPADCLIKSQITPAQVSDSVARWIVGAGFQHPHRYGARLSESGPWAECAIPHRSPHPGIALKEEGT